MTFTESDAAYYAIPAVVVLASMLFYFAGRALQWWLDREQKETAELREAQQRPCDRCGKPVLPGAEEYHRRRCSGSPRGQKSYRFGRGERIDR